MMKPGIKESRQRCIKKTKNYFQLEKMQMDNIQHGDWYRNFWNNGEIRKNGIRGRFLIHDFFLN